MADEKDGQDGQEGQDGQDGREGQDGLEGQDRQDRREADAEIQDGESLPKRGAAELKAILEALIFASPDPLTPKAMCKLLDTEPKEDVARGARRAEAGLRSGRAACSWSRSPAAIRSSRGPICTSGCGACSTSGRRRS